MLVVLIRTVLIYITITIALRLMGKRQLGELQPNELVVTIIISNIATLSLQDNDMPIIGTLMPIFMLVSCEVLFSYIALWFFPFRKAMAGSPVVIIKDGKVDQKEMRTLRWTVDDLMAQLRIKDIFDISEVSFAMVETSGELSVYPKFENRPYTAKDAGLQKPKGEDENPPVLLISDGIIIKESMAFCRVDREWVDQTLKAKGFKLEDVFFMTCDKNKKTKLVRRES